MPAPPIVEFNVLQNPYPVVTKMNGANQSSSQPVFSQAVKDGARY